ncbi:MAG TPA: DUF5953 family protein [Kofleriaceae bacterium]
MPLVLDAFAPPLALSDPRALTVVRAVEHAWGLHLTCSIEADGSRIRHETDLEQYLASDTDGGLAFLATPDDEEDATLTGLVEPDCFAPGGVDELHVLGWMPMRPTPVVAAGLEQAADALQASWAMLTPGPAHAVIVLQVIAPTSTDVPPAGLPRLDAAEFLAVDVPRRLGWISYWSDRAAANIGFDGSADVFASVTRVASGWIVQLTNDPLDLDRGDHLRALRAAYERYPAIGRRQHK